MIKLRFIGIISILTLFLFLSACSNTTNSDESKIDITNYMLTIKEEDQGDTQRIYYTFTVSSSDDIHLNKDSFSPIYTKRIKNLIKEETIISIYEGKQEKHLTFEGQVRINSKGLTRDDLTKYQDRLVDGFTIKDNSGDMYEIINTTPETTVNLIENKS